MFRFDPDSPISDFDFRFFHSDSGPVPTDVQHLCNYEFECVHGVTVSNQLNVKCLLVRRS